MNREKADLGLTVTEDERAYLRLNNLQGVGVLVSHEYPYGGEMLTVVMCGNVKVKLKTTFSSCWGDLCGVSSLVGTTVNLCGSVRGLSDKTLKLARLTLEPANEESAHALVFAPHPSIRRRNILGLPIIDLFDCGIEDPNPEQSEFLVDLNDQGSEIIFKVEA